MTSIVKDQIYDSYSQSIMGSQLIADYLDNNGPTVHVLFIPHPAMPQPNEGNEANIIEPHPHPLKCHTL